MWFRHGGRLVMAVAASVAAVGCAHDNPTSLRSVTPTVGPVRTLLGAPVTVVALQRTTPLAAPEVTSATIGLFGGQLSLPNAGLTVVVPAFAIASPTTLTVTAIAGSDVAYEFAPHGLTFQVPLVATQDLRSTHAGSGGLIDPLSLGVGYFTDTSRITSVVELLAANVDLLAQTSTATLWHFSGYIWSSGRDDGGAGGDSTSTSAAARVRFGRGPVGAGPPQPR